MQITFDDTRWGSATAILAIYFSLPVGTEPKIDELSLERYIRARLDRRPTQNFRLSEKQEKEIDKIFAKLNSEFEFIDVHYKAKSLTWLRFAFQALRLDLQPSGTYLKEYSVWRAERAAKFGFEMIEYTNDGTNRNQEHFFVINKRELCGHTLDEFLLKQKLCFNPFVDESYRLEKARYRKQHTRNLVAIDDPDNNPKNILAKRKRGIREVVGKNNYENIRNLVNEALGSNGKLRNFKMPHRGKTKDRFRVINISRDGFIDLLMAKFPSSGISRSTIRRAITDFVAFDQHQKEKIIDAI
jgi:hypothetical protein